jgi:RNA polymerase sigma factor (sigma-70 family)
VTDTTHGSLLLRVRNPRDEEGWRAFYDIYSPLILRYAQTRGLRPPDAEEVLQECMTALARTMRTFEYSPEKGKFKSWLRSMVNNQVMNLHRRRRERQAGEEQLAILPDDHTSVSAVWDRTWRVQRLSYCLEDVRAEVAPKTYEAFCRYVLDEWPVSRVAEELGITANDVYLAKSRITRRLKDKMHELLGDDE